MEEAFEKVMIGMRLTTNVNIICTALEEIMDNEDLEGLRIIDGYMQEGVKIVEELRKR
ncbi:MAG: hypothetical protein U0L26_12715 [Cellulosilyticum sp.]|nr:hypothetical protein [Cellulosilyticum sp.]